jgi:hypothetical protein
MHAPTDAFAYHTGASRALWLPAVRSSYAAWMTWTSWRVFTLGITAAVLGWIGLTTLLQQLGRP